MRYINFGSINIDHVYAVDHFVRPGETTASSAYSKFAGGKGFNQSVALARAGAEVFHAGRIGSDGTWLRDILVNEGVKTDFLAAGGTPTGHAVIQVDPSGQNCIIIHGGANREISPAAAASAISHFGPSDGLLLQNEISSIPEIMKAASDNGLPITFNPAPMGREVLDYPLELVKLFIVNETEAAAICGKAASMEKTLEMMCAKFPHAGTVITHGDAGAMASIDGQIAFVPARHVPAVVDTTAAGDTFIGYLLALMGEGASLETAMKTAAAASAICVSRSGASPSIPMRNEVVID